MLTQDEKYMNSALKEALKGAGKVSPNPLVGAVIVKNGKVIGKGHHHAYGQAHAEVNAIESCSADPKGSDMYVTLEPCSHFGKTPPCADRIIKEKIKRVFIGTLDPSAHCAVRGAEKLINAGIDVKAGICEKECLLINAAFFHYLNTKKPMIILKAAASLDGSIATDANDSKWITGEISRKFVHRLRNFYDAVLVGRNTVVSDNPSLTVRSIKGRNPVRIVVDRTLSLPTDKNIFDGSAKTIVITSRHTDKKKETSFIDKGITLVKVEEKEGILDLKEAFDKIGNTGIRSIMVEGGGIIHSYLLKNKLVDRVNIFLSPKLIGNGKKYFTGSGFKTVDECISLDLISTKKFGDDIFIDAFVRYNN